MHLFLQQTHTTLRSIIINTMKLYFQRKVKSEYPTSYRIESHVVVFLTKISRLQLLLKFVT